MKKISIFKTLLCGAMFVLGSTAVFGQGTFETPIFSEDFGNLADGTALSTSNTAFSYVRVGTGSSGAGTNKVAAKSPSSFTGSSMVQGARTASISTIDKTGMASFNKGAFTFKVKTPASLSGATLFSAVGAGASFASVNGFTSAQLSTAFQINGTNLQVRAGGAWTTVQTVETSTSYTIALIFNNSGSV